VPNFFGDAWHRVSERQRSPLDRHSGSIRDVRLTPPENLSSTIDVHRRN
jgi:hypothetical protein